MDRNIVYVVPSSLVEQFKQKARKLKRECDLTHTEALDAVAHEAGFHHWKHVAEAAASTAPTEQAYLHGLIVAYDSKDANDGIGAPLVADSKAGYFCECELRNAIPEWLEPEEGDRPYKEIYADSLAEVIDEVIEEVAFYRFEGDDIPTSVEDALSVIGPCSFWPPTFMWLRGHYYDLSNEPAKNREGNIVGVRL